MQKQLCPLRSRNILLAGSRFRKRKEDGMAKQAREVEPTRFEVWRRRGRGDGGARRDEDDPEVPDSEEEETLDGKVIGLRLSRKDRESWAKFDPQRSFYSGCELN
jgi:hypothetical protein